MRHWIQIVENMSLTEGRIIDLKFQTRFNQTVDTKVISCPSMNDIKALLAKTSFGVRGIVGDNKLYIWDGSDANHVSIANQLGFDVGQYISLWFLHESDDPFEPNDDWYVDGKEPIVDGVRILPGRRALEQPCIQRLGYPASQSFE